MELTCLCTVKEAINLVKWKPTEWQRIFASYTPDRGLIYKEPTKQRVKRTNDPVNNYGLNI